MVYGKCSLLILVTTLIGCDNFSTKPGQGHATSNNPAATPVATTPVSKPVPVAQATPDTLTIAERKERIRELLKDAPLTPEEWEEIVHHISVMAAKGVRGERAMLKRQREFVAQLPKGEVLERGRQLCADIEQAAPAMAEALKQVLHDPSSLQDFKVEKCAPMTQSVHVRAGFRAKNTFGALVINEEHFLVTRDSTSKAGFKAYVLPEEMRHK